MVHYSLRRPRRGVKATEALELVATNVPLPKPTAAALRLVCRSTRRAVDESVKSLSLNAAAAEALRPLGTPLTADLTALSLFDLNSEFSGVGVTNGTMIAVHNAKHMEALNMPIVLDHRVERAVPVMLGAVDWPRLRFLTLSCFPGVCDGFISIDYMPRLTKLHLYGGLDTSDLNALRQGRWFPAAAESLTLRAWIPPEEATRFFEALAQLLQITPRLQSLALEVENCQDFGFLAAATLPALNSLVLDEIPDDGDLEPLKDMNSPNLRTLELNGGRVSSEGLAALVGGVQRAFPALETLKMTLKFASWEFMREMSHQRLNHLEITCGLPDVGGIEAVASGLSRLTALEHLELIPGDDSALDIIPVHEDVAMKTLLSGPPLHRLRRLETGGAWMDADSSVCELADASDKLPALEELILWSGHITSFGFIQLAEAGCRGRMPRLKLLQISEIEGDYESDEEMGTHEGYVDPDFCRWAVQRSWPGLEVKVG